MSRMSQLPPPPKEAMPIVELIRNLVKRPKGLPTAIAVCDGRLRWPCGKCPMGFLPKAECDFPFDGAMAGLSSRMTHAVQAFGISWWDSLRAEHAKAACDLIWPRKRRTK